MKTIMYVSSSGGHYQQLKAIFENSDFTGRRLVVAPDLSEIDGDGFISIRDANIRDVLGVLRLFFVLFRIIIANRPDLIVSTGAAPGGVAIFLGRFLGVKGLWIDSMANTEEPSLTGRLVRGFSTRWLSQSSVVSKKMGGEFYGKIFNIY